MILELSVDSFGVWEKCPRRTGLDARLHKPVNPDVAFMHSDYLNSRELKSVRNKK
jgi:hypothetical protein